MNYSNKFVHFYFKKIQQRAPKSRRHRLYPELNERKTFKKETNKELGRISRKFARGKNIKEDHRKIFPHISLEILGQVELSELLLSSHYASSMCDYIAKFYLLISTNKLLHHNALQINIANYIENNIGLFYDSTERFYIDRNLISNFYIKLYTIIYSHAEILNSSKYVLNPAISGKHSENSFISMLYDLAKDCNFDIRPKRGRHSCIPAISNMLSSGCEHGGTDRIPRLISRVNKNDYTLDCILKIASYSSNSFDTNIKNKSSIILLNGFLYVFTEELIKVISKNRRHENIDAKNYIDSIIADSMIEAQKAANTILRITFDGLRE